MLLARLPVTPGEDLQVTGPGALSDTSSLTTARWSVMTRWGSDPAGSQGVEVHQPRLGVDAQHAGPLVVAAA